MVYVEIVFTFFDEGLQSSSASVSMQKYQRVCFSMESM